MSVRSQARLRALDKKLTPEQKREVAKAAMRKLLDAEKAGSKKAKAALDKIRAFKPD
jgi:hypothetical protein